MIGHLWFSLIINQSQCLVCFLFLHWINSFLHCFFMYVIKSKTVHWWDFKCLSIICLPVLILRYLSCFPLTSYCCVVIGSSENNINTWFLLLFRYESNENMTITCSSKVCSFGKQVVEKVEVLSAKSTVLPAGLLFDYCVLIFHCSNHFTTDK